MDYEKDLTVTPTNIPGLVVFDLPVRGDNRGWFKENYQKAKLVELGLPADFTPVQNNISFNENRGTTRGLHEEPWNKFISVGYGEVFGAWVDLREGESFGQTFSVIIDPSKAVFVPEGVANGFQTLTDNTVYTYLVDAHWSPTAQYHLINADDSSLGIEWPIPLDQAVRSDKDKGHPTLSQIQPLGPADLVRPLGVGLPAQPKRTLVVGSNGQLGRAIRQYVEAHGLGDSYDYHDIDTFDISDPAAYAQFDWQRYSTIINASAYTAVDAAETAEGRLTAWKANVTGVANLAKVAGQHGITLVHVSSDYVFDGTAADHSESESFSPLGVYGQTKAAADAVVGGLDKHYILRSSWVIGDGKNFVRTMQALAGKARQSGQPITVVDDQYGRLTFTADMAEAIFHLLGLDGSAQAGSQPAPCGTYNLTGSGRVASWREIAQAVFRLSGTDPELVQPVSTEDYFAAGLAAGKAISPRPTHSDLDLAKITATGYSPRDWEDSLRDYLEA